MSSITVSLHPRRPPRALERLVRLKSGMCHVLVSYDGNFSLFRQEFCVQFFCNRQYCFVRLFVADVGCNDHREIAFCIEPDVSEVHAVRATMV